MTSPADVHANELGDEEISTAMHHLRAVYPGIDGLQHPGLGLCVAGKSLPRFNSVVRPFVQVFNIGDHWITATNIVSSQPNDIYCFDSSHSQYISPFTVVQLSSLLRRQTDRDDITVIHRACP